MKRTSKMGAEMKPKDASSHRSRKRSYDKENSKNMKCSRWSLGGDVGTNPPLLADMGLSILQDEEAVAGPSPTPPTSQTHTTDTSHLPKVLQHINQNIARNATVVPDDPTDEEEFFVYKRRRIDSIAGDDRFNRLSDELILAVFRWLPKFMLARCAQVSRRWKRLAFDETLWRRLDLGSKTLKPGVVGRVILRGCSVLRLAKAEVGCPIFSPQLQHLPSLSPVRSRLQYLDLSMAALQPQALEELLSVCYDLKKLSLEHCTLNASICSHLAKNTNLDTLNLAMCYGLNHAMLVTIFTQCKKLQSLNLAWTGLSSEDLRIICRRFPHPWNALTSLVAGVPSLMHTNFGHYVKVRFLKVLEACKGDMPHLFDPKVDDFSDADREDIIKVLLEPTLDNVRVLVEQCPGLVELDVSDGTHLTAAAVSTIIKQLHHAEYLAFSRCYTIQPDAYLELKVMPNLLYLDVYGILSETAVSTLQESLPQIKINKYLFSSVARPTVGIRRTSVWGLRVRD